MTQFPLNNAYTYGAEDDNVDGLGNLLVYLLDSVVGVFEQAGVDLPSRRYVTYGGTAHDCEQLTVSFIQMYLGPPGDQAASPQRCHAPRTALLAVEIARQTPAGPRGAAPSQEAITQHALTQSRDATLLLSAAADQTLDPWGLGLLADVTVTEPQGAYQAVVLNLTVAVP